MHTKYIFDMSKEVYEIRESIKALHEYTMLSGDSYSEAVEVLMSFAEVSHYLDDEAVIWANRELKKHLAWYQENTKIVTKVVHPDSYEEKYLVDV